MSANSDTVQFIAYCERMGLTVEKGKHGGYRVLDGNGKVICYARTGSNQPPSWLKASRHRVKKALDGSH